MKVLFQYLEENRTKAMALFDNVGLIYITEGDDIIIGDYDELDPPDMITVSDGVEKITVYTADMEWRTQLAEFLHGII